MDWFLYDSDLRHEWVNKVMMIDAPFNWKNAGIRGSVATLALRWKFFENMFFYFYDVMNGSNINL